MLICATCSPITLASDPSTTNIACLNDVTPDELAAAPVRYEDGANDDWDHSPAVLGYL